MQTLSEKVEVVINERHGRHLVATLDIEPGDTLLEETPLMVSPHWDAEQMKCSQCFQDSFLMCKKCQMFPLCLDCNEHNAFECQFFCSSQGMKISKDLLVKNYGIFAVLKLLLLMENPEMQSKCEQLKLKQLQLDDYRQTEMWQEHAENVVAPLMQSGIAELFQQLQVTEDLLQQLCVIIDAYAFEVTGRDGDSLKGVYAFGAQLPHNCVPNTVIALDEDFQMRIYAAVPLRSGDVIYNNYANPMMGTSQRQHHLQLTRHITCECARCLDPTELGTHMSSVHCTECTDGYAVCDIGKSGHWICVKCGTSHSSLDVNRLLVDVGEELVSANGDLHIYESLLVKYANHFHPNHFLLLDIKQNIAIILRSMLMNPTCSESKDILARRLELSEQLLPVARAVVPGISKLYAISLYEYLLPFLELAEIEFRDKDIQQDVYCRKLHMAKAIVTKALDLLIFEPENSPEGHLVERLQQELKHIESKLKKLESSE